MFLGTCTTLLFHIWYTWTAHFSFLLNELSHIYRTQTHTHKHIPIYSLSLPPPPSPSLSLSLTHTHTHTHTQVKKITIVCVLSPIRTQMSFSCALPLTCPTASTTFTPSGSRKFNTSVQTFPSSSSQQRKTSELTPSRNRL